MFASMRATNSKFWVLEEIQLSNCGNLVSQCQWASSRAMLQKFNRVNGVTSIRLISLVPQWMELWRYGSRIAWHLSTRLRMARLSTKPSGIQPTKAFLQVAQPINLSESGIPGLEKMSRRSMHIQMMSWVSISTSMRISSRHHLQTTWSKFLICVPTWTSLWWCWWVTS